MGLSLTGRLAVEGLLKLRVLLFGLAAARVAPLVALAHGDCGARARAERVGGQEGWRWGGRPVSISTAGEEEARRLLRASQRAKCGEKLLGTCARSVSPPSLPLAPRSCFTTPGALAEAAPACRSGAGDRLRRPTRRFGSAGDCWRRCMALGLPGCGLGYERELQTSDCPNRMAWFLVGLAGVGSFEEGFAVRLCNVDPHKGSTHSCAWSVFSLHVSPSGVASALKRQAAITGIKKGKKGEGKRGREKERDTRAISSKQATPHPGCGQVQS
eukprot:360365-Chlamydomonas_euryale.AAC.12